MKRTIKMEYKNIPETYEGYSTNELLAMWKMLAGSSLPKGTPEEKIITMSDVLMGYKISPEARA